MAPIGVQQEKADPMRALCVVVPLCVLLTACGGTRVDRLDTGAPRAQFASGAVGAACRTSGRDAASRRLCGCIQSVADRTLRETDQRRAASFFADPHQAQVVKMSDSTADDAFWDRYKVFADMSERTCRGL